MRYDHCIGLVHVLNALVFADFECIAKLLPLGKGPSKNGKTSIKNFTNLFMELWYENTELISTSFNRAKKFLLTKRLLNKILTKPNF